jgi:CheY-like chemotaxis protein
LYAKLPHGFTPPSDAGSAAIPVCWWVTVDPAAARDSSIELKSELIAGLSGMTPSDLSNLDAEPFGVPYRLLVVDDNRDAATSMRLLLQLLGCQVLTAYDGLEALASAEKFLPHAVVLDVGMPRLNGLEVARRLRAQEWAKGMVLVALSGWCREEDRRQALEAGFDGHLAKPVHAKQIRDLLQSLLTGRVSAAEPP